MTITFVRSKLKPIGKPKVARIDARSAGFFMVGHTDLEFGFVHEWEVGPFKSEAEAWQDYYKEFPI